MTPLVLYGDKLSIKVSREYRQLVNISIAAGKFILIHPHYNLIKEAMRLDMFEDTMLEAVELDAAKAGAVLRGDDKVSRGFGAIAQAHADRATAIDERVVADDVVR